MSVICPFLVNFQPVLLPSFVEEEAEEAVENIAPLYDDRDSEYDADTECSGDDSLGKIKFF